jgi:uncharacterized membrane protein
MRKLFILPFVLFLLVLVTLSGVSVYASGTHEGGHGSEKSTATRDQSNLSGAEAQGHESGETTDHHQGNEGTDSARDKNEQTNEAGHTDHSEGSGQSRFLNTLLPGLTGAPNIHPMLVHFPIVFLWTSLLFVGASWFWKPEEFLAMAKWMFWLGLVALPITAGTGFWAIGGWGGGHVTIHRNVMLITTGLAFLLFGILRWLADRQRLYRIVMTVGLIIVVTFMTLGADRGAWLVFVEGSGVKPAEHVHGH